MTYSAHTLPFENPSLFLLRESHFEIALIDFVSYCPTYACRATLTHPLLRQTPGVQASLTLPPLLTLQWTHLTSHNLIALSLSRLDLGLQKTQVNLLGQFPSSNSHSIWGECGQSWGCYKRKCLSTPIIFPHTFSNYHLIILLIRVTKLEFDDCFCKSCIGGLVPHCITEEYLPLLSWGLSQN